MEHANNLKYYVLLPATTSLALFYADMSPCLQQVNAQ